MVCNQAEKSENSLKPLRTELKNKKVFFDTKSVRFRIFPRKCFVAWKCTSNRLIKPTLLHFEWDFSDLFVKTRKLSPPISFVHYVGKPLNAIISVSSSREEKWFECKSLNIWVVIQSVCNEISHFILSFDKLQFEHSVKKGVWQGSQKKIDGGP